MNEAKLGLTDVLALDRTRLAAERTLSRTWPLVHLIICSLQNQMI